MLLPFGVVIWSPLSRLSIAAQITAAGIFARRVKDKNKGASISKLIIEWSLRSSSNQFNFSTSLIVQNVPSKRPKNYFSRVLRTICRSKINRLKTRNRPEFRWSGPLVGLGWSRVPYLELRRNHRCQQYFQRGQAGPFFVPIRLVSDINLDQNPCCNSLFSHMQSLDGTALWTDQKFSHEIFIFPQKKSQKYKNLILKNSLWVQTKTWVFIFSLFGSWKFYLNRVNE